MRNTGALSGSNIFRKDSHRGTLDKDEQVEELVIDATLKPTQKEFRHGYV